MDTCTPVTKNIYTGKNQDPTILPAPEMYFRYLTSNKPLDISRVIRKARQSDRDIPKLSYRSGMTALSKMSGQESPGLYTSNQKYLHWQKSRPNNFTSTRNVFSILNLEQTTRYIKSHSESKAKRS